MFENLGAEAVAAAYPRLDAFRRVRWELTDNGTVRTFDNDFSIRCGLSDPPIPNLSFLAPLLLRDPEPAPNISFLTPLLLSGG